MLFLAKQILIYVNNKTVKVILLPLFFRSTKGIEKANKKNILNKKVKVNS